jgi:hypothetical protein
MTKISAFTRIVVGLHYGLWEEVTVDLAAELAELLHLDLFGLFLADESVLSLAGLPFAREFRLSGGGWQPIDVERISIELELETRRAKRRFSEAVRTRRMAASFQILKASTADALRAVCRAGDIVMIAEPANFAVWASHPLCSLVEAARQSASAVLLVPRRVARQHGAVVALAAGPDDPSIDVAAMIAVAAKEELVVIDAGAADAQSELSRRSVKGAMMERRSADASRLVEPQYLSSLFERLDERLIVVTRRTFDDALPSLLGQLRRVPILALDPKLHETDSRAESSRPER